MLGFRQFLAKEQIRKLLPSAPYCPEGWGLTDNALYGIALVFLEEYRNRPVFLNLLTSNTHPRFFFTLPEEAYPQSIRETQSALRRSLFEADRDLMLFFHMLGKMRLFTDDTLVILTADHSPNFGMEFLEVTGHPDFFPARIPCLFITPDKGKNPFRVLDADTLCDQLDLMPTLADALGLRKPDAVMGQSLFAGGKNAAIRQYGYDLRINTPAEEFHFGLTGKPSSMEEASIRKWYYNNMLSPYERRR